MTQLLDVVLEAHGAARWKRFRRIEGEMSITGLLWARKGWPEVLKDVRVIADIAGQHITYQPFTADGLCSDYRPDRVAIVASDGKRLKQRANPREAFADHRPETLWDELHLAYFSGYAMWNYLTFPHLLTLEGVEVTEGETWPEAGETWRRLNASFPPDIDTHSSRQTFYVDADGRLRRHDYVPEVIGRWARAAHLCADHLQVAVSNQPFPSGAWQWICADE